MKMINNRIASNKGEFPLAPITSEWMEEVLSHPNLVGKLMADHGSPINLHHIGSFEKNIKKYNALFKKSGIDGKVYFARKANKSKALVRSALKMGIGIDTASQKELEQAVLLGGAPDNIVLTAAVKTPLMVQFAITNQIPIIIDNRDELDYVECISRKLKRKAPIGLRISGFIHQGRKLYSRFGFDIENDSGFLKERFSGPSNFEGLELKGLHFHLDGYSIPERTTAVFQCLELIEYFAERGRKLDFLDIGGGILMNYLRSGSQWENFQKALQRAVAGESDPITFGNIGLGFRKSDNGNGLAGRLGTYPYYNEIHGATFLERILESRNSNNESISEILMGTGIQLRIEPGRSLLDQVGITIARVVHRKRDSRNDWLIGLEMNMSQLRSSSADYLVDPFVIYHNPPESHDGIELYFTGAYCLEQDVILKRKLTFPGLPQIGDFVVFINTGGYMMHFYETEAHLFDLSANLVISGNAPYTMADIVPDDSILSGTMRKGDD